MTNKHHQLAQQYYSGKFNYTEEMKDRVSKTRFKALDRQFRSTFDDFYHDYYEKHGSDVDPIKALIRTLASIFLEYSEHLPTTYKPDAISSGTQAHLIAVRKNHHTTDKLGNVAGDEHKKVIKDNSQRNLARAELLKNMLVEAHMVEPVRLEGTMRNFADRLGRTITGGTPIDGADYMSFWNMVLDRTKNYILDDIRADMPTKERVLAEIEKAQTYSNTSLDPVILETCDWVNSRNSILEMARGNYIRFGLHPLRPEADMQMYLYDGDTEKLYPARLLDTFKPVVQNILRWAPQGIATEEACRTAARLIHIHRMRTDSEYNAAQTAPLVLDTLDPFVAEPTHKEVQEFDALIEKFEPFLLKYCPHLIRTGGLPDAYQGAQENCEIKPSDIGETSMRWQRRNIPATEVAALWDMTLPSEFDPKRAKEIKEPSHGKYVPQRAVHSFSSEPFETQKGEIWADRPYDHLDEMSQDLSKALVSCLEILVRNPDSPDFHGVRYDLKRGDIALDIAKEHGLADQALLPARLGRDFNKLVRQPTLDIANNVLAEKRHANDNGGQPTRAFGSPDVTKMQTVLKKERPYFAGPGPEAMTSDFRIGFEMEMLRRNYTSVQFQKNWETSEDNARMMMMATKLEFGKVERPAGNDTEIKVLDFNGNYMSFYDRYDKIRTYLSKLKSDPAIQRAIQDRNPNVIESYGLRHVSLTLARFVEIFDCLQDEEFNQGRFEMQRVEHQK